MNNKWMSKSTTIEMSLLTQATWFIQLSSIEQRSHDFFKTGEYFFQLCYPKDICVKLLFEISSK